MASSGSEDHKTEHQIFHLQFLKARVTLKWLYGNFVFCKSLTLHFILTVLPILYSSLQIYPYVYKCLSAILVILALILSNQIENACWHAWEEHFLLGTVNKWGLHLGKETSVKRWCREHSKRRSHLSYMLKWCSRTNG